MEVRVVFWFMMGLSGLLLSGVIIGLLVVVFIKFCEVVGECFEIGSVIIVGVVGGDVLVIVFSSCNKVFRLG